MKFNQSQISEIIQMAWDDQTDFSHIKKIYEIDNLDFFLILRSHHKNEYSINLDPRILN